MEINLDAINEIQEAFAQISKAILEFAKKVLKILREMERYYAKPNFNRFTAKKDIRNPAKGRPRRAYPP